MFLELILRSGDAPHELELLDLCCVLSFTSLAPLLSMR